MDTCLKDSIESASEQDDGTVNDAMGCEIISTAFAQGKNWGVCEGLGCE